MGAFDDMISVFSPGQPANGTPLQPPPPQSSFFDQLIGGALRGTQQAATKSDWGAKLQGWLTQGQSQVAAQNLFGNPVVLMAAVGLIIFGVVMAMKK